MKLFVSGSIARAAGEIFGVHRNTAVLFFTKIRRLIAEYQEQKMSEAFEGSVGNDESYFGGKRKGIRGRGAAGKIAVFG
ncbi:MAG: IS1595 family transposase, partial [Planctomycetes bacterium]|nr:IS1595 family transposase [Planctomycetota bacterium]